MLTIGLCGLGVVGKAVVLFLRENEAFPLNISKILVRQLRRSSTLPLPDGFLTLNSQDLFHDPSINCIVELIGGTTTSWDLVRDAILSGKHVVTANKALIALNMERIRKLLEDNPHVHFRYEAAVGGGLPIINLLQYYLSSDRISCLYGILNGTTNYILTQMEQCSMDFDQALALAQSKGYAEADAAADISGEDARYKLMILANLCFGVTPKLQEVGCCGIQDIRPIDFVYAQTLKKSIKLIAVAHLTYFADLFTVSLHIAPSLVEWNSPLRYVNDSMNGISIQSKNLGKSFYMAQGAGGHPTAYAVARDLLDIQQFILHKKPPLEVIKHPFYAPLRCTSEYTAEFYIRFSARHSGDSEKSILDVLNHFGIRIKTQLNTIRSGALLYIAIITTQCLSTLVFRCTESFKNKDTVNSDCVLEAPVVLHLLNENIY